MCCMLLAYIVCSSFIAHKRADNQVCSSLSVVFKDNSSKHLIDENSIMQVLENNNVNYQGVPWDSIDIASITKLVQAHPAVQHLLVCRTPGNDLKIQIKRRKALLRIKSNHFDGYLTQDNQFITNKGLLPVHSPVATGVIDSIFLHTHLHDLITRIAQDDFFSLHLQQIHVNKQEQVTLIPRIGDYEIYLGKMKHIPDKLNSLKMAMNSNKQHYFSPQFSKIDLRFVGNVYFIK